MLKKDHRYWAYRVQWFVRHKNVNKNRGKGDRPKPPGKENSKKTLKGAQHTFSEASTVTSSKKKPCACSS